jgi:wobble nucleotide-excising tRNase
LISKDNKLEGEMLKKIVKVQNVGRFISLSPQGNVSLEKLNLIYATNGKGKTSLSSIFKSLSSNDVSLIGLRKTFGVTAEPFIHILGEKDGTPPSAIAYKFTSGAWSQNLPEIEVFDIHFVNENVYEGESVELEQRKRLHKIIIGQQGVVLNDAVTEKGRLVSEANTNLTTISGSIQTALATHHYQCATETFVALPEIEANELAARKATVNASLKNHQNAPVIASTALLTSAQMEKFDLPLLTEKLALSLQNVEASAQKTYEAHLSTGVDKEWIAEGVKHSNGKDECPFCKSTFTGNSLIEAYRVIFSEAYNALKSELSEYLQDCMVRLSSQKEMAVTNMLSTNAGLGAFWITHQPTLTLPTLTTPENLIGHIRSALINLLEAKQASPLEPVNIPADLITQLEKYNLFIDDLTTYLQAVTVFNDAVTAFKNTVAQSDIAVLQNEKALLGLTELRYGNLKQNADAYNLAVKAKADATTAKDASKAALDAYTQTIFPRYEAALNKCLAEFNLPFKVENVGQSFKGSSPSANFVLKFKAGNDWHSVEMSNSLDSPCFKSILSTGDKSALGLSFFFAQLLSDPTTLANKILVIDDPFTSQDRFRRETTKDIILRMVKDAKQVIILSHSLDFLELLRESSVKRNIAHKILQLSGGGDNIYLTEYDLKNEVQAPYFKDYLALRDYLNGNNFNIPAIDIKTRVRKVLEDNIRFRFPADIAQDNTLGGIIEKIKSCPNDSAIFYLRNSILQELEEVNEYSKSAHHGGGDNPDSDELKAMLAKAFKVLHAY